MRRDEKYTPGLLSTLIVTTKTRVARKIESELLVPT
jgi:hypothetical protein